MDARTPDRRAESPGGRSLARGSSPSENRAGDRPRSTAAVGHGAATPADGGSAPWALLALADGTLWRGQSIGGPGPAHGKVRVVGELVLVEGENVAVLRNLEPLTPGARLDEALDPDGKRSVTGFAGASGATLPLHGSVACAIARGEIGRP